MTSTWEDADDVGPGRVPPGDRSVITTIRGLSWWATLLLALVLTLAGVAADLLRSDSLGVVFVVCYPTGCVLAVAWARRRELFVPMVQPPLLLAVAVPVVVAGTGALPASGGLVSTALAVGGPLINGFPTMAITTAVCLALGFVRTRVQPRTRPNDEDDGPILGPPPRRPDDRDRPRGDPRDRPARDDRPRDDRPRDDRPRERRPRDGPPRDGPPRDDRPREDRPRDPRDDRPPGRGRPAARDDRPRERPPKEEPPRDDRPREDRRPRDVRPRAAERSDEDRPPRDDRPRSSGGAGAVDPRN